MLAGQAAHARCWLLAVYSCDGACLIMTRIVKGILCPRPGDVERQERAAALERDVQRRRRSWRRNPPQSLGPPARILAAQTLRASVRNSNYTHNY